MTEQWELDAIAQADIMIDAELGRELLEQLKADAAIADFLPLVGEDYEPVVVWDEDERDEATNVCVEVY
jgi:hypothetical protein